MTTGILYSMALEGAIKEVTSLVSWILLLLSPCEPTSTEALEYAHLTGGGLRKQLL